MDDSLSNHEMLLQQLQELKRELAKKERKLMKMEKAAQARKRASMLNPERKLPSVNEETNDDLRQHASTSYASTNSSVNDVLPDIGMLNSAKECDKYCSKDGYNSVSQRSCSNACEYQEGCALSLGKEHLCKSNMMLPHESADSDNCECTSSSVSSKENKGSIEDNIEITPENRMSNKDGNDLPHYSDCSSVKMSDSELSKESGSVSNKNLMKNNSCYELCVDTRVDAPSEIFCTRLHAFVNSEAVKQPSSSVDPSVSSQNLHKAENSLPLKVDCSFDDHIATQQSAVEDESICIKEKFPGESGKSKSSQSTLEMKLEQNNFIASEHPIALVSNIGTDRSECPENKSRFVGVHWKCKGTDLSSFSEETLNFSESFDDKADKSSLGGKDLLKSIKTSCKVDVDKADKKIQQNTADISSHNDEASSCEVVPWPSSFRRSQRLAKQAPVCEKKHSAVNKSASDIVRLFGWLSQKCKSNDVTYFELPPEEFGLLMEIKVKNSNQDAWPHSPSESFEMLTPEEFVPDSEEDKNPYCYSPKRLFSSLAVADSKCSMEGSHSTSECFSNSIRTMLADNGSPSKTSGEGSKDNTSITTSESKELHLRSEFSSVNSTQDSNELIPCTPNKLSSFQKSPEKPVIFYNSERQGPLKSKHLEQHVVLETEGFDIDLVDMEKSQTDKSVCLRSPAVSKYVANDVTFSTTSDIKVFNSGNVSLSHTTLNNHDRILQECDVGEDMEQLDLSLIDSWGPLNTSEFDFHSVNKATDEVVDIISSRAKGSQRKLFDGNDYLATDAFLPDKMLNTVTGESLPDVKNCDLQLQNNFVAGDGACNSAIGVNTDEYRNLSFLCCLETENKEPVKRIHIFSVSDEVLIAVQCDSVIEIWKKVLAKEWTKLGIYNTENMTSIEKSYVLSSGKYVIFVLLVCTNGRQSIRFLSMDANLQVIQVMANNSFEQNSNKMRMKLILCGLEGLTFATAEGNEYCSVDIHFIEAASNQPFLTSRKLSNVSDCLLGLSGVQNLPKAVMGWSLECFYIWNYVSGSPVTAVNLVPKPLNIYDKCLWATCEEGILFLLLISADKNSVDSCHLVAVNPVTGLWDAIQYFQHSSHKKHKTSNKFIDGTVLGSHVILACCQNGYLWDLYTGSNTASLAGCNVMSITCSHDILAVSLQSGCANLYSFH